jgi:hypothetical protein
MPWTGVTVCPVGNGIAAPLEIVLTERWIAGAAAGAPAAAPTASTAAIRASTTTTADRPVTEQGGQQHRGLLVVQRGQRDGGRVRPSGTPAGALVEQLRPGRDHHQQIVGVRLVEQLLEEVEQGRVGPVQVLDHQDQGLCRATSWRNRRQAMKDSSRPAGASPAVATPTSGASRTLSHSRSEASPAAWPGPSASGDPHAPQNRNPPG